MKASFLRRTTISLLALGMGAMVACTNQSDEDLLGPSVEPSLSLGSTIGGVVGTVGGVVKGVVRIVEQLAVCLPLPTLARGEVIGPRGGTISVGAYDLSVPAGALDRNVRITMEQIKGPVNSVRFSPEGLQFAKPATLSMGYRNCKPNPNGKSNKILYVDEQLRPLEAPPSVDNRSEQTVNAKIGHFSRYAIAW